MPPPYTNNCEVDFVGNIKIPVLILEATISIIDKTTLYDLVFQYEAIEAYLHAYGPLYDPNIQNDEQDGNGRNGRWFKV